MIQTNFMDEIDCGNFFDHIDDLLEFPNDDAENGLVGKSSGTGGGIIEYEAFPPLWTGNSLDPVDLPGSQPAFSNGNSASDLSAELSVPYEDIVQLEWLSTFVEDSFSGGGLTVDSLSFPQDSSTHQTNRFQTSSPVSVLESSSASSNNNNIGGKTMPVTHEKRARSKRPRPATFTPRPGIQLMAPHSESESVVESSRPLLKKVATKSVPVLGGGELQKKKKKIKILPPSGGPSTKIASQYQNQNQNQNQHQDQNVNADTPAHPVRKCLHCEITKTPQWRAGPLGPKTLCNACGVRYKSGRLYPEYRPAASPTFVPSLHSNSHKKVLEMRTKTTEEEDSIMTPKPEAQISPESELLPAVAAM